jgi:hypothetical protein
LPVLLMCQMRITFSFSIMLCDKFRSSIKELSTDSAISGRNLEGISPVLCLRNARGPHFRSRRLVMGGQGSDMVTYGDIWRTAVDEPQLLRSSANFSLISAESIMKAESFSLDESRTADSSTLSVMTRPVAQAATIVGAAAVGAANNIWTSLTKGPSDEEVCALFL